MTSQVMVSYAGFGSLSAAFNIAAKMTRDGAAVLFDGIGHEERQVGYECV
jgi:hypothetical protein